MARPTNRRLVSRPLHALTVAALALPGMSTPSARAGADPEVDFQIGHYQEGERNLAGQNYRDLNLEPLQVDSLNLNVGLWLNEPLKLTLRFSQDTWSGATPVATMPHAAVSYQVNSGASAPTGYFSDRHHVPTTVNWESYDGSSVDFSRDKRLVHLMASASPETRKQLDAKFSYSFDTSQLALGFGGSEEPDYRSRFVNLSGLIDFDQKLTTLNWSCGYSRDRIDAIIDANAAADWGAYLDAIDVDDGVSTLHGRRQDRTATVGVTRILSKGAALQSQVAYTHSAGYLENPYKAVILAFDNPDQDTGDLPDVREVTLRGVLEQRPDIRSQWAWTTRFVQHVARTDAALHVSYRRYRDSWKVNAHTLEASWDQPLRNGWMITPLIRRYAQSAARFYRPYFFFQQAYPVQLGSVDDLDHARLRIDEFSSDHRLSAFGALSLAMSLQKQFGERTRLAVDYEHYRHAGSLAMGGDSEDDYADFRSDLIQAVLSVGLDRQSDSRLEPAHAEPNTAGPAAHQHHFGHAGHSVSPAGVMFDHMLSQRGDVMIGYRLMTSSYHGDTLRGSAPVASSTLIDQGCGGNPCYLQTTSMRMYMHMLDVMYALSNRVTLMLMPQFLDMRMTLDSIEGAPPPPATGGHHGHSAGGAMGHAIAGLGDTSLAALVRLVESKQHKLLAGLGVSAPTGSVEERMSGSDEYIHYGMQPGSGTWDLLPSLTYTGLRQRWSWGLQFSAAKRLESRNVAGYALGDLYQTTGWGTYRLSGWLSMSVRAAYGSQAPIRGAFKPHWVVHRVGQQVIGTELVPIYERVLEVQSILGPMDLPANYGGRTLDLGLGLNAVIQNGPLEGNRLSLEWLEPLRDRVEGFQLARSSALTFSWSIAF